MLDGWWLFISLRSQTRESGRRQSEAHIASSQNRSKSSSGAWLLSPTSGFTMQSIIHLWPLELSCLQGFYYCVLLLLLCDQGLCEHLCVSLLVDTCFPFSWIHT